MASLSVKTVRSLALAGGLSLAASGAAHAVPLIPTLVLGAGGSMALEDGGTDNGKIQDESEGYKVFGGVEATYGVIGIQPSLGFEVQYSDLGNFEFNGSNLKHQAETVGVSAIAGLQLLEMFRANVKGGVHFWDNKIAGASRDGNDFFYGLSGELTIAPFSAIRVEWEHFLFEDDNIGLDSDVDVGSVSLVFRIF